MRCLNRRYRSLIAWVFPLLAYGDSLYAQHYEFLTDIFDNTRSVEMLWWEPDDGSDGPYPTILFVHGFQAVDPESGRPPGASAMLETPSRYPLFKLFRRKGFLVAAVSQAGFGGTDGPLDFCGPFSQQAILTAIAALHDNRKVRARQVFLHGRSRGAVAASMAATQRMGITGVILESGVYDVKSEYHNLLRKGGERAIAIAANIEREAGITDESFEARSILLTDLGIPVPILLLHGTADTNTPVEHSLRLQKHLVERGGFARLVTFDGQEHHVNVADTEREIDRFIRDVVQLNRTKADTDRIIQSLEKPKW